MRHSKPMRLETAPTGHGGYAVRGKIAPTRGESVYLFLEFTIN